MFFLLFLLSRVFIFVFCKSSLQKQIAYNYAISYLIMPKTLKKINENINDIFLKQSHQLQQKYQKNTKQVLEIVDSNVLSLINSFFWHENLIKLQIEELEWKENVAINETKDRYSYQEVADFLQRIETRSAHVVMARNFNQNRN